MKLGYLGFFCLSSIQTFLGYHWCFKKDVVVAGFFEESQGECLEKFKEKCE